MSNEEKKQIIIQVSKELFATKGYHSTSVSDIINKAGIARGTFYLYFDSKRAVFENIINSALIKIKNSVKPIDLNAVDKEDILKQLRINLSHIITPLFNDKLLASIFVTQAENLDFEANLKIIDFYTTLSDWLAQSLKIGQENGIIRQINTEIMAIALIGAIKSVIWAHSVAKRELDPHEVVEELTVLVSKGIVTL